MIYLRRKLEKPVLKIPLIIVFTLILIILEVKIISSFVPEGYKLSEKITSRGMEKELTEANKLLRDFPIRIPGARRVDRYETPGARYCLVQIRQVHQESKRIEKIKSWEKAEIVLIQKDIYQILNYLWEINKRTTLEVYIEGLYPELEEYRQALNKEYLKKTNEEEIYSGAVFLLENEGKVVILPAETLKGVSQAEIEVKENRLSQAVFDKREDILLKKIAENSQALVLTIYGSLHAWGGKLSFRDYCPEGKISFKDNIGEWNKNHPNKKFSLIEITPESLVEIPK